MSAMAEVKNITNLSGRVAVVIGGTSGLGKAIAIGLAESGADVVPSGRRNSAYVPGGIEGGGPPRPSRRPPPPSPCWGGGASLARSGSAG